MKYKTLLRIVFLASLFQMSAAFAVQDRVTERGYVEDKSRSLALDQVTQEPYENFSGLLNKGYSKSIYWIKFSYLRKNDQERLFLRILPTFLDEIKIYQKIHGQWKLDTLGDHHSFSGKARSETSFAIELDKDADKEIFLSINTRTSKIIDLRVLEEKDFVYSESRRDLSLGIYFGILVLLIGWSVYSTYVITDKVIILFMLFLISEFIHGLSLMGYLAKYFLSDSPILADNITNIFAILHTLMGMIFHRTIFRELQKTRKLVYAFNFFISFYVILLLVYVFADKSMAVAASSVMIIPIAASLFYVPYIFRKSRIGYEAGIFWTYLILACALLTSISPYLGLIKAAEASLYASMVNGLIMLTTLTFLIQRRRNDQELSFYQAKLEAELSQQEVSIEKMKREQQSQFMSMLNHELKTPLSILKIAYSSDETFKKFKSHVHGAITDITAVIDRSLLVDKYEDQSLALQQTIFSINDLVKNKIDSFELPDRFSLREMASVQVESDLPLVKIIIANLLDNAVKYGNPVEPIKITVGSGRTNGKDDVFITVANMPGAAGMPDHEKIFKKYYRSSIAQSMTGSGLGLYLIKNLSLLLKGDVQYVPLSGWIIFEFRLPVRPASEAV